MLAEWLQLIVSTINWRLLWQRLWALISSQPWYLLNEFCYNRVDAVLRMFRDRILNSSTIINISISTYLVNLDIFLVNFVITGLPTFVGTGCRIFLHWKGEDSRIFSFLTLKLFPDVKTDLITCIQRLFWREEYCRVDL